MEEITEDCRARAIKLATQLRHAVLALSHHGSLSDGGMHFYGEVRELLPKYELLYPEFMNCEGMFGLNEIYPIMRAFFEHLKMDKDHNLHVGEVYRRYGHEAFKFQDR